MSSISSYSPQNSQVNNNQNDNSSLGSKDLLGKLSDRVSQTLAQKDNPIGGGQSAVDKINPQDVAKLISDMTGVNQPGALCSQLI
jgi:hypothetical protein